MSIFNRDIKEAFLKQKLAKKTAREACGTKFICGVYENQLANKNLATDIATAQAQALAELKRKTFGLPPCPPDCTIEGLEDAEIVEPHAGEPHNAHANAEVI